MRSLSKKQLRRQISQVVRVESMPSHTFALRLEVDTELPLALKERIEHSVYNSVVRIILDHAIGQQSAAKMHPATVEQLA